MKTLIKVYILLWCSLLAAGNAVAQATAPKILKMELKGAIDPRTNRHVKLALEEAEKVNADYVLIELDTYGGAVNDADEIRKRILDMKVPVLVFINKNAASAGALISIACDSIYMAPGANIGAATVVTPDGKAAPGKYQSYMRSIMRSTAEENGRNPKLAEAMVDAGVVSDSTIQAGQVVTLTTEEAIKKGFCEGQARTVEGVLEQAGLSNATVVAYEQSGIEKVISFFLNPVISGILLLIISGGIYFELQTPGIGFPLAAAVVAGLLYLVPYYLTGLAEHWEILLLLLGVILLALEIFVIPGFGIAGISGIGLMLLALVLVMINNVNFDFTFVASEQLFRSLTAVVAGMVGAVILVVLTWNKLAASKTMQRMVLQNTLSRHEGYHASTETKQLVGKNGITYTRLSPSGRVMIDDILYEAQAREGYIDKNEHVTVVGQNMFVLLVKKQS
ncbi:MAG: nodulation protein NfeD [Hymenobacteraceae bacterium]|nr:nodulation protein NfeD [Hymenobacteraceae bacterium]MDX5395116.1 nodulation protein NfeD [Hymenobacteraceae bacterium]MDX5443352.1 nodulation protein NfeD [Hymenobacteraceae bacterium]MDX5511154.1 nodulation protein NfeD [Hymenobacteraceae bacterium]